MLKRVRTFHDSIRYFLCVSVGDGWVKGWGITLMRRSFVHIHVVLSYSEVLTSL
jgi:hypothetical protein